MRKRFVPRELFNRFGVKLERTDYLHSSVYELKCWQWLYVSVGRRHITVSVWFA
jgi:hypothetical protein